MRQTLILLALYLSAVVLPASAAETPGPRQQVEEAATRLFAVPETAGGSDSKQSARIETHVQDVLDDIVDFPAITSGVLGEHRDSLSASQREPFQHEFERSIIQLLATALGEIEGYDLAVEKARMHGETRAQVPVIIRTDDQQTFEIQFTLALAGTDWRVRNLIVNGVNLGLTYRNQFGELMKIHNGDIDAVIKAWSETTAEVAPAE